MEQPEVSLGVLIAIGAVLLLAGVGIGLLVGRNTAPGSQKYRETERRLDQVLQEKKAYEDEVVEHFSDTAKLLNNLTESYRELHNQLAAGAGHLCKEQGPISLSRMEEQRDQAEIPPQLADIQPPLDYAPKHSPDEQGMLSEGFGLDPEPPPDTKNATDTSDADKTDADKTGADKKA